MGRLLALSLFALCLLVLPSRARADEAQSRDAPRSAAPAPKATYPRRDVGSVAAIGTWGAASLAYILGDTRAADRWGAGISAGYTFRSGLYAGVMGVVRRGGVADQAPSAEGGGEVGWDVSIGIVTVRPLAGAGVALVNGDAHDRRPALWPGVAILGACPGSPFYAGVDGRLVVALGERTTPTSFVVAGARL